MKATPPSMACQRTPKVSLIEPATSGPTPSHRKPITAANTSVLVGVGKLMKYQAMPIERST